MTARRTSSETSTASKKTATKKATTKKAATKKAAAKKPATRKAAAKKTATKKPAVAKSDTASKKTSSKKATTTKPATRKAAATKKASPRAETATEVTAPAATRPATDAAPPPPRSEAAPERSASDDAPARGRDEEGGRGRHDEGGRGEGRRRGGRRRGRRRSGRGRRRGRREEPAVEAKPVKKKVVRKKSSPAVAAPSAEETALRRETLTIEEAAGQLGIEQLRPEQEEVIEATLEGRDTLMIVPTGFGKSACYQLPSMLLPKPVVVISPLIALLEDQHTSLVRNGVPVVRLDGGVRGKQREQALDRIEEGGSLLILTTPETLANPILMERLQKSGVSLVAVDEAHCISEWGYDFRPAYRRIGAQLRALGSPPLLALTATATEHVREAIIKSLRMRDPVMVDVSPHRSNLAFEVLPAEGDVRARVLIRLIKRLRRPGIVYCSTRREVDMVWGLLKRFRIPAHRYHGGMTAAERETEQHRYMRRGHRTVMIATNAFGLGIDKQDIRYVLHYQSPASLEQYVQEAGRGGRDGKKSNCILLYDPADREIHQALLNRSRIRPEQLFKLGAALEAWTDEQRSPNIEALALSADIGPRITQALLAKLEEAGFVEIEENEVRVVNPERSIEEDARSLAGQFERLKREDSRRLDLIGDYAAHADCRAQFLQSYFGEDSGEECGLCDVCRGKPSRPTGFFAPIALPKNDRNKRRRSSGRGRGNSGGNSGGDGEGGGRKRGGRRRSRGGRRRRGRGAGARGEGGAPESGSPSTPPGDGAPAE